jgi:hypothetical protein
LRTDGVRARGSHPRQGDNEDVHTQLQQDFSLSLMLFSIPRTDFPPSLPLSSVFHFSSHGHGSSCSLALAVRGIHSSCSCPRRCVRAFPPLLSIGFLGFWDLGFTSMLSAFFQEFIVHARRSHCDILFGKFLCRF